MCVLISTNMYACSSTPMLVSASVFLPSEVECCVVQCGASVKLRAVSRL